MIEKEIDALVTQAMRTALSNQLEGQDVAITALVRAANDDKHGDYQVNGLLPLAKRLKQPPAELAAAVLPELKASPVFADVSFAAPGFINLKLAPEWVAQKLTAQLQDAKRQGVPLHPHPERIIIDYSSPNVAKQMHVGHLRSTILGESLARILAFVGHKVHRDNHLGDYGTQFGLLIAGIDAFSATIETLADLENVYQQASAKAKDDPAFAQTARQELAKLQQGDARNRQMWERFVAITRASIDHVYQRLDVHFDSTLGESAYAAKLEGVVNGLIDKGLAREDQGALCVFFEDIPELKKTPFIVRKQDGAYLYSTTDVATIQHRIHEGFERSIYVVDARQALHFKQLFELSKRLGYSIKLEHVAFGSVLGADGKPLKTREGKPITLEALLDEAISRARAVIEQEGVELDGQSLEDVAQTVGVGAVKFADLKQNRLSDYRFDWDKLISFKGHSGPYLQYAYARICSLFRKGGIDLNIFEAKPIALSDPHEHALARQLLRFADAAHQAANALQPHLIADHAYNIAKLFSAFYENCPILSQTGATRDSRLALAVLSARQLKRSLDMLGLQTLERM